MPGVADAGRRKPLEENRDAVMGRGRVQMGGHCVRIPHIPVLTSRLRGPLATVDAHSLAGDREPLQMRRRPKRVDAVGALP